MSDFESLREKFSLNNDLKNDENLVKPLKEITHYNMKNNDDLIEELTEEVNEQEDYNLILKDKNIEENNTVLKKFIENNEDKINQQYTMIKDLSKKLKNLIIENNSLEENEKEYTDLLMSEKSIDIANKINELKDIKKDLKIFLKKNKIILKSI